MHKFFIINNLSLNETHPEVKTNVLKYNCKNLGKTRAKDYHNIWLSDLLLTKGTVALVGNGGRSRWHIENQTFNTLKNQGYNFEHNFGHGYNNLSTVMVYLMFSAF